MWSENETRDIHVAIDAAYERVKRLKIPPEYVVNRLSYEYPELWRKTLKIEEELTPKVPFNKAMSMLASWEGTWRQIEMKVQKRAGRKKNGSSR
jgi:hypothetical protein